MKLLINTKQKQYPVIIEKGSLNKLSEYLDVNRHYFVISDTGVPKVWKDLLCSQLTNYSLYEFEQGEKSKSLDTYQNCLKEMLNKNYQRSDAVIALGGGVVGDLAGFVAASYLRGIDFIQIPTTTLSQIDSSIGGKVAVDLDGFKNCVGAFWQPSLVLIDFNVLDTLSERHFNNGLFEALKASLLDNEKIFSYFEKGEIKENIDRIIIDSLLFKKGVVEKDENESGLRRILNFGHTIGHAIESNSNFELYHGEAVGLGMLYMIKDEVLKERVKKALENLGLDLNYKVSANELIEYIKNDKKAKTDYVECIEIAFVQQPKIVKRSFSELLEIVEGENHG